MVNVHFGDQPAKLAQLQKATSQLGACWVSSHCIQVKRLHILPKHRIQASRFGERVFFFGNGHALFGEAWIIWKLLQEMPPAEPLASPEVMSVHVDEISTIILSSMSISRVEPLLHDVFFSNAYRGLASTMLK